MSLYDNDDPSSIDALMEQHTHKFEEFLSTAMEHYNYRTNIARMLRQDHTRLIVNVDDLRSYDRELSDGLLKQPMEYLPAFDVALETIAKTVVDSDKHDLAERGYKIGLSGSFGDHHVNPRTLRALHIGKMISIEGIVTRCSLVRPKMQRSVHYCADTKLFHARDYRDATSISSHLPPTSSLTPQTDDENHLLEIEYGLCTFRDHQRVSIQEMPERAPAGQLPRSVDVIFDDDLVDTCKPGDRIQLVGIYRSIGGGGGGTFK